jgi:RND family efflux transporter MFP subunit
MKFPVASRITVVVVAAASIACWLMISRKEPPITPGRPEEPVIPVRIQPVEPESRQRPVALQGEARARSRVVLKAQVGGLVLEVSPDLERGQLVSTEQVLVTIDPTDHELDRRQAAAALAEAQAAARQERERLEADEEVLQVVRDRYALQEAEVTRLSRLRQQQLAAAPELERVQQTLAGLRQERVAQENVVEVRRSSLTAMEAAEERARAALDRTLQDLARTRIVPPFPAHVAARMVEPGELVTPGTALVELVDLSVAVVEVPVPLAILGEVTPGHPATVRIVGQNGPPLEGTVRHVGVAGEVATRTVIAEVWVEQPGTPRLLPGTFVDVRIAGRTHENVLVLPEQAVSYQGQGAEVFLAQQDDAAGSLLARRVPVELLWREPPRAGDGARLAVVRGPVPAGSQVILTSLDLLDRDSSSKVSLLPSRPANGKEASR